MLRPAAFVMENVKGMLSSSVGGKQIFKQVMSDLQGAAGPDSYRLVALCRSRELDLGEEPKPADFLVRAEAHGVPQTPHRVIIVGLRSDIARGVPSEFMPRLSPQSAPATVQDMIGDLVGLRSALSSGDSDAAGSRGGGRLQRYRQGDGASGGRSASRGSGGAQLRAKQPHGRHEPPAFGHDRLPGFVGLSGQPEGLDRRSCPQAVAQPRDQVAHAGGSGPIPMQVGDVSRMMPGSSPPPGQGGLQEAA